MVSVRVGVDAVVAGADLHGPADDGHVAVGVDGVVGGVDDEGATGDEDAAEAFRALALVLPRQW